MFAGIDVMFLHSLHMFNMVKVRTYDQLQNLLTFKSDNFGAGALSRTAASRPVVVYIMRD